MITTTPLLQYKVELGLGGYEDIPNSLAVSTKLESLRNLQETWRSPQPQMRRQPFDLPLPQGWRVENWMIVDGVFGVHSIFQSPPPPDGNHTRLDLVSLHDVAMKNDPQSRRRTLFFEIQSSNSVMCLRQELVILICDNEFVSVLYFSVT